MQTQFEAIIIRLLKTNPYYGHFLMEMRKVYTNNLGAKAAVGYSNNKLNFYISPTFFESSDEEQIGIVKHECLHVINKHLTRHDMSKHKKSENRNANIAADLAINQYIDVLHKSPYVNLTDFTNEVRKTLGQDFEVEAKQTFEYYYDIIQKVVENGGGQGFGDIEDIDDHSKFNEDDINPDMLDEIIKKSVQKAASKCSPNSMDPFLRNMIEQMSISKVSWKKELRSFVTKSIQYVKQHTRKRLHRVHKELVAGRRKEYKAKLGIIVDTSGSINDEVFSLFMNEINKIEETKKFDIFVGCCDTQFHGFDNFKKGAKIEFRGGGGTNYQPGLDACVNEDMDLIVYFGDMEHFDSITKPSIPVCWAIVGNSTPKCDFGKKVFIEE